jgi:hypothetical protein
MSYQPTTLRGVGLVRRPARRWAENAAWAGGVGVISILVGLLAGAAPMVLFGVLGVVLSAIAFLGWPVLAIFGVLLLRPAIDDTGAQIVLGPANALGAIGVAVFVGGIALLLVRGPRMRMPAVTVPFVAFLAVALTAVSYAPSPTEAIGFWVQLTSLFLMFCVCAKLFRETSDLRKLVEEAGALALVGARERGVRSVFDFMPGAHMVFADRVQIQQVLINLMRNAIEAMRDSERKELNIRTAATADGMVEVEVSDTGPGISDEISAQLFRPFVTTKAGGMGVGLSISKRIIESHGGEISVRKNGSGGASFRFTLPAIEDE